MSKITLFITIIIIIATICVLAFIIFGAYISNVVEPEVFKLTYQFLLIVVLGGAISLLYKQWTTIRDLKKERRISLREMHADLLKVFNIAKQTRRYLRAHVGYVDKIGVPPHSIVLKDVYESQLYQLSKVQLTFEVYAKRASDSHLWFIKGKELAKELQDIEKYLRKIIDEFECEFKNFSGNPPSKSLSELPALHEFIDLYKSSSDFSKQFKYPFRNALVALSNAGLL